MKFETHDTVIRDICQIIGDEDYTKYPVMARIFRRVVQQLKLHFFDHDFKTIDFTIDDNLTVSLPPDVEIVTKVGIRQSNGEVAMLVEKKDMVGAAINDDNCTCDEDAAPVADESGGCYVFYNYMNAYGEMYGTFIDHASGYWKHDHVAGRLNLSGVAPRPGKKAYVEYKTQTSSGDYALVPEMAFPMIKARVLEWYYENKDPRLAATYNSTFRKEIGEYKRIAEDFDIDSLITAIRSSTKASVKS